MKKTEEILLRQWYILNFLFTGRFYAEARRKWNELTKYDKAYYLVMAGDLPEMLGVYGPNPNTEDNLSVVMIMTDDFDRSLMINKIKTKNGYTYQLKSGRYNLNPSQKVIEELYIFLMQVMNRQNPTKSKISNLKNNSVIKFNHGHTFHGRAIAKYINLLARLDNTTLDRAFDIFHSTSR